MWAPQPGDHWGLAQLSGLVSAGSSQGPDWVGSVALSVWGSQAGPAAGAWGCSPASLWLSREGWSWGVAGRLQVATWAVWGPGPPGCLLLCHSETVLSARWASLSVSCSHPWATPALPMVTTSRVSSATF